MISILVLSRYDWAGPSSRYRFYQFLPYLEKEDFEISVSPLFNEKYISNLYSGRRVKSLFNPLSAYLRRTHRLLFDHRYDIVWMEKEALPWIPASIEKLLWKASVPYVIDYDDAIFHRYDQHNNILVKAVLSKKISQLMSRCLVVVAGNKYIADYAERAGSQKVVILPSVVDTNLYVGNVPQEKKSFTIGWIGSPSTSRHLQVVASALSEVCKSRDVRFSAIGAQEKDVAEIPGKVISWNEATEIEELNRFDVGIMPLPNTSWERGKCGFKLIQYMACGLPVIASPVGMNKEIVDHGVNGFLAIKTSEWIKYIKLLKNDSEFREKMGKAGQEKVKEKYSLQSATPKLVKLLREVVV